MSRLLDHALNFDSGLVGLAGSGDMSELGSRVGAGRSSSRTGRRCLRPSGGRGGRGDGGRNGGLDALVFTAGIGERSQLARARVCGRLGFLGVALDAGLNEAAEPDADVASMDSSVRVVVLEAREDLVAARAARALLAAD